MPNRRRNRRDSFWVSYGVPAGLVGTGIGLVIAGPNFFWWGIPLAIFGSLGLARGWHHMHKDRGAWIAIAPSLLGVVAFNGLILWLCLRGAPLIVTADDNPGVYAQGTLLAGIAWSPAYRDVRLRLKNDTDEDYTDVNVTIVSGKNIADIGAINQLGGQCTKSNSSPEIGASGPNIGIPLEGALGGLIWRIHCDRVLHSDQLEIVMAMMPFGSKPGGPLLPKTLPTDSAPPTWIAVRTDYVGRLRYRSPEPFEKCFQGTCPDMPAAENINWKASNVGFYFRAVYIPPTKP